MQKVVLLFCTFLTLISAFGQKTELKVSINSGLFSFYGESARNTSFINYSISTNIAYTNNPYGSKNGLCYGLSTFIHRVTKKNLIVGLDLGYEILKSKILINGISSFTESSSANGKTFLKFSFLNTFPFLGYRINIKKILFDIKGGLDIAYCLRANEDGVATASDSRRYTTSVNRRTIDTDIRPRIQVSMDFERFGIHLGYSLGLSNYQSNYIGGDFESHARLFRFGITLPLK